ncbi:MAG: amidohydrolase family protein [Burkholderiales bacterium]|jgi:predicted TIM-barrel fold metal-dependent hydrolase
MSTAPEDWLALVREDAIDPDLPIIDAHHHLWDYPDNRYVAEDLRGDVASGHNIRQSVFVECLSSYRDSGPEAFEPVGETEYVSALADQSDATHPESTRVAAAIVGFADLSLGSAVQPVLEAHIAVAPARFRGIRHASSWDASDQVRNAHTRPPPQLLLDTKFREGFAFLENLGLSFDAWLYHPQICELTDLARAYPGTRIILDHVGGVLGIGPYANRRDEIFQQWKRDMAELATCDNVCVKLGGLAMKLNGFGWHTHDTPPTSEALADATAPYYHYCMEVFGAERCMFESNFPVEKLSVSYGVLWNSFKRISAGCSASERAALFHDTAQRVYRLVD